MPGYSGYRTNVKRSWNVTTLVIVVVAHLIGVVAIYRIAHTEYVQNLIKVSKLITIQEPVKPPDQPPPPEPVSRPDALPELPQEPLPIVKPIQPEPAPEASVAEEPEDSSSDTASGEIKPVDQTPFAIGKGHGRFSGYESLLTASIQAVYQQPPDLPDSLDYAVLCQLIVDEDGYVLGYKLLNSSGNEAFDRSTQQALSRLRHVRPPPEGISRTIIVKFFPP